MEYLRDRGDQVVFLGRPLASKSAGVKSREAEVAGNLGAKFIPVDSVKFDRRQILKSLVSLPLIFGPVFKAMKIIDKHRPEIVVSFGGYLSVPVALAAFIKKVPLLVHEQTAAGGLANRVVSLWAVAVAISYDESRKFFPVKKTILTGNLIRSSFFEAKKQKTGKYILVTGGSQGSLTINQTLSGILPKLLNKVEVYHQTGDSKVYRHFETQAEIKESLPADLKKRYHPAAYMDELTMANLVKNASLVISRSGANTISEIMASGTPAILIPLPKTQMDEQVRNASIIARHGAGEIISQEELTPEKLLGTIAQVLKHSRQYREGAKKLKSLVPEKAVEHFYRLMTLIVAGRRGVILNEPV